MNWQTYCEELIEFGSEVGLSREEVLEAIKENEEFFKLPFRGDEEKC